MTRLKVMMLAVALCLSGAVFAAGSGRHAAKQSCDMNKAGACCCAHDASCCQGGSCCAAHKAQSGQAQAKTDGDSCCAAGADCCKGGSCCVAHLTKK